LSIAAKMHWNFRFHWKKVGYAVRLTKIKKTGSRILQKIKK